MTVVLRSAERAGVRPGAAGGHAAVRRGGTRQEGEQLPTSKLGFWDLAYARGFHSHWRCRVYHQVYVR